MATISFKGQHVQRDMILKSMRWYLTYFLNYSARGQVLQSRILTDATPHF